MEFQEESVDLTKEIIDKAINILQDIIPLIHTSKLLKKSFNEKNERSFQLFFRET
jgi:hypothetical protein